MWHYQFKVDVGIVITVLHKCSHKCTIQSEIFFFYRFCDARIDHLLAYFMFACLPPELAHFFKLSSQYNFYLDVTSKTHTSNNKYVAR